MALDAATFKARFPVFANTDDPLIEAKLAEAARSIHATAAGDRYDDVQGYYAARLLALMPQGVNLGLRLGAGANQRTVFDAQLETLQRQIGTSYRMILD